LGGHVGEVVLTVSVNNVDPLYIRALCESMISSTRKTSG